MGAFHYVGQAMQFLVYLSILMVSVSTVLLEIHWLTTPPLQPKSAVQASATPPRPKVEGPNAELSPVYPRKVEPVQPPPTQNNVQYNVGPAATGNTAARAETVQKPVAETTGVATRSESAAPPDNAQNAQAYAAPPKKNAPDEAAASNNRCDVQACASAYKSFRASDCTYQPLDGP
ncbi:MAG: BA14K family protein, partial [Pseudolabrys sp.]